MKKAFTLIEILVVIGIIAILMGLLFPAIQGAINQAKKTMALNDCVQISGAYSTYEAEYGSMSFVTAAPQNCGSNYLLPLMGTYTNSAGNVDNPKGLIFLDINNAKPGHSGFQSNVFIDPWGGPYRIVFDINYGSDIRNAGTNSDEAVRKDSAVWNDPSTHPDATNLTPLQKKQRYARSW